MISSLPDLIFGLLECGVSPPMSRFPNLGFGILEAGTSCLRRENMTFHLGTRAIQYLCLRERGPPFSKKTDLNSENPFIWKLTDQLPMPSYCHNGGRQHHTFLTVLWVVGFRFSGSCLLLGCKRGMVIATWILRHAHHFANQVVLPIILPSRLLPVNMEHMVLSCLFGQSFFFHFVYPSRPLMLLLRTKSIWIIAFHFHIV